MVTFTPLDSAASSNPRTTKERRKRLRGREIRAKRRELDIQTNGLPQEFCVLEKALAAGHKSRGHVQAMLLRSLKFPATYMCVFISS
jgi:hypothetical protein